MSRMLAVLLLVAATRCVFAAQGANVASPEMAQGNEDAPSVVAQRVRDEMQRTLSHMAADGALGPHPESLHIDLVIPARRAVDLGLLVDATSAAHAREGLRVLGTSPGGAADQLGVRAGDIITAVNGHSLRELGADSTGRALAAATLKASVDQLAGDSRLQLDVRRDDALLSLNGSVRGVQMPSVHLVLGDGAVNSTDPASTAHACGRISLVDLAPRQQHLYGATVLLVDGVSPGPSGASNYRVSAGDHELMVGERIPTKVMGMGDLASLRRNRPKTLSVTVKPNTTVLIAARFNESQASQLNQGNYWEPVAWKVVVETCP